MVACLVMVSRLVMVARLVAVSRVVAATAVLATLGLTSPPAHADLVVNGGFEAGNTGFSSGYTSVTAGYNALISEGAYTVAAGSQGPVDLNQYWTQNVAPHSGNSFMVVNGASVAGVPVWGENGITVAAQTTYYFSTWIASVYSTSPAALDFSINGNEIGGIFNAGSTVGVWQQFYASWNSGSTTTANISIVNQNIAASGNDFALDDISLNDNPVANTAMNTIVPIAEPFSLALLGTAVGVLGMARRRRPHLRSV